VLKVEGINFFYGEVQALRDVSFTIETGTITTLLGANGAGKTTLMRVISGLYKSSSGTVNFLGKDITNLPPHKIHEMGLIHIPEGRKLFPRMTVKENLELGAGAIPKKQRDELFEHMFELFPTLKARQNQKAETLSGGEQQQVAISRGLMGRPRLLLLDEPTLGLSPVLTGSVLETATRLNKEDGITILLVSQEVISAVEISDYGYVLENGRVVIHGDRSSLMTNSEIKTAYLGI
jgi:branched-chain amino acid transport system ATP-binding protein